MGWRTVVIGNPAQLRLRDRQLIVEQEGETASVPVEDIDTLILESAQVSVTAAVLRQVAEAGGVLIICDQKHLPAGIFLPQNQHYKSGHVVELQINASQPLRKRLWQRLVFAKIENQGEVLKSIGSDAAAKLRSLVKKVESGDKTNVEAQAARVYWPALFGPPFRRGADTACNAALNYGYAIVRATLARAVVGRGLLPVLGLFHRNYLNPFCLVDDLIEPYRPLVDRVVYEYFLHEAVEFDRECRAFLLKVLHQQVRMAGDLLTVTSAATLSAESLVRALREKEASKLTLPTMHQMDESKNEF